MEQRTRGERAEDVIFWLYAPCSLPVAMTIKEIQNGRSTDGE
jgi:hypothetical protein